jgi:transcriptional regulator with XRE-family HTH domain
MCLNEVFMNRIKELRKAKSLTQEELGERIGTTGATIQRLESGKRKLTEQWMRNISEVLGVQPAELFGETIVATGAGLPVKGEVQAGVWHESHIAQEPKLGSVPLPPDPRYSDKEQWALLVQGTSMNKKFEHGEYLVCVKWADLQRKPKTGDLVVVERRRDGMIESTVKRISIKGAVISLVPESTDPRWQTPIEFPDGADGEEVEITALVVGRYAQL